MKNVSLCFVINTVHRGKKILYRFPPNIFDEAAFELSQDGATKKPYTPESLMDIFLSNTNIFSCIGQDFFDYSLSFIAELFSPRRTSYQNAVAFVVEDLKFIALPVFISADHRSRIISSSEHSSTNEQYEEKTEQVLLYSFNTVLVFDEKEENVRNLKELLQFFSKSLDFEERNHSFVSKQIYKAFEQNFEFQTSVKNLLKDYNKGEPLKDEVVKQLIIKIQDLSEEYRKKVALFNLLEEVYKSIANLKPMKFKMDDCVLRTFNLYSESGKMVDAAQINPFQTILIMKKKCCDQLGLDSSSRFKKFIDHHNPKKSFLEMSADLDLALDEITLYAAHLVNWQAGKIIHVISKESVYGINPELERGLLNEELFKKFSKRFKSELIVTLNTFSKPLPIAKVRDKLKMESPVLFKLITWFLKHSYLIEYNYYIYINCPKEVLNANINSMKNSSDEKKRKQGEILEKLSKFSYKKVSLNQIAFENDIPKEKLFKIVFQNKNLVDYYLAE